MVGRGPTFGIAGPKTLGDIHRESDACYHSKVDCRKWFDEKGKKLVKGALENPRLVLSSERRCKKRMFEERMAHTGRGISLGQEGSNEDETELFGGKQIGFCFPHGIRRRFCEQQCATRVAARVPSEHASSIAAAGRQERDVKHSNRHHDGINITVP